MNNFLDLKEINLVYNFIRKDSFQNQNIINENKEKIENSSESSNYINTEKADVIYNFLSTTRKIQFSFSRIYDMIIVDFPWIKFNSRSSNSDIFF